MKKVLVVMKSFAPVNNCGSIPNTKLVKALCRQPLELTVLTGPLPGGGQRDETLLQGVEQVRMCRVSNSRLYEKTLGAWHRSLSSSGKKQRLKAKSTAPGPALLQNLFFFLRARDWYGQARRYVKKTLAPGTFDVVFTSFPEEDALLLGRFLRRGGYAKRWVADFRDPMWYAMYNGGSGAAKLARQHRYVREADKVTVVSEGALEKFRCADVPADKLQVLPNGFDPEELTQEDAPVPGRLQLCYAGSLYGGRRDLTPLFAALRHLVDLGLVEAQRICLCYAGQEWPVVRQLAARWGLEAVCRTCGEVPRHRVLQLLRQSDLLLVCTHNTNEDRGVVTGKIFELLMIGHPILALVSGARPGSELAAIVRRCQAGFVWEECRTDADSDLERWLLDRYREKLETGRLQSRLNSEARAAYGYDRLAGTLAALFEEL